MKSLAECNRFYYNCEPNFRLDLGKSGEFYNQPRKYKVVEAIMYVMELINDVGLATHCFTAT